MRYDDQPVLPNAYPLIELFLFLVLALTGQAAGATKSMKVEPPVSPQPGPSVLRPLRITIDSAGTYYLGQRAYSRDELLEHVKGLKENTPILIEADTRTQFGVVVELLAALRAANRDPLVAVRKEG